jgi:hypothetical protein
MGVAKMVKCASYHYTPPGLWGGWQWTRDSEKVASINLRVEADPLNLTYRVRVNGGEWEDVAETVRTLCVACRFGGGWPYFICPGVVKGIACGRRVTKLHGPGRYLLCRHCYRLCHASQSEGVLDRTLRRANKIRQRLRGAPGMAAPFRRSRRACGGALTSGCASKPSQRRHGLTMRLYAGPNTC